jgi:hypothetical protein
MMIQQRKFYSPAFTRGIALTRPAPMRYFCTFSPAPPILRLTTK